ncbi:MAG: hypothetical protein HYZ18_04230 [Pseudogulbenkiania sp.]|nr:hypothetical protein [Pseudogulbenkiania sp.]
MAAKDDLLDITPEDTPVRELKPLQNTELVVAEAHRVQFHVRLPAGATLDDTLVPDFWKLSAHRFHISDLIEVEPLDQSFWALLLVRECNREHAKVALLQHVELTSLYGANVDDLPLGHSVSFMGPKRLWAAMHGTTILKHSFSTKTDAVEWLKSTLR